MIVLHWIICHVTNSIPATYWNIYYKVHSSINVTCWISTVSNRFNTTVMFSRDIFVQTDYVFLLCNANIGYWWGKSLEICTICRFNYLECQSNGISRISVGIYIGLGGSSKNNQLFILELNSTYINLKIIKKIVLILNFKSFTFTANLFMHFDYFHGIKNAHYTQGCKLCAKNDRLIPLKF